MIRKLILPALCLMGPPAAAQSTPPAILAENIVGPALYVTDPDGYRIELIDSQPIPRNP